MKPPSAAEARSNFDSRHLRRVFDRRAPRWSDTDFLVREVAHRLLERLDYIKLAPTRILDAGCGTGADFPALHARYPQAYVVGADLSLGMARTAAEQGAADGWRRWLRRAPPQGVVQADFGALPLADGALDLVWSNLALHWRQDPHRVIPEWHRVLRTDGLLLFSTFGPDTLRELRAAWAAVDAMPHVIAFTDMHDLGDMMVQSGFGLPVVDMETFTVTYETPAALLRDVRLLGGNPMPERFRGLTGRRRYRALCRALEQQRRPDGVLALTFEFIYGHAWRTPEKTDEQGNAVVRLQDIGGRRSTVI
ncbi:amidophosphoribosyltransferase [Pandoraea thiooxydans]|uniref:Malonyl-[acyl-carrier protein] O-methyltransferase n=1 Tax=Pandoraea thiooxydans TaxID=445709 RepID=A0A0G3EQJ0_9BURK|nr:malonyl-ACP O-methyltransferase BioC [Pandoraea thiooxydans]AKJ69245.1 malonyl-[acyl-carrier protein] O-methyltransferase BioC [Pandoraea thiooxydans]APR96849.1 amidophosphoribosyltransferase [Pandoraea thiooxydans]